MKKFLPHLIVYFVVNFILASITNAAVMPHIGASYFTYNGSSISGSASLQIPMVVGEAITIQVNGANTGSTVAPSGGISLGIPKVTTLNGNQINLTNVNSPGSNSSQNTWWIGDKLGNGSASKYLLVESSWNNWSGGSVYKSLNVTFTVLQVGD